MQRQRAFERTADSLAVRILANAGFDPTAFAAYIRRVQPVAAERAATLEAEIRGLTRQRSYSAGEDLEPIQREVRRLTAK